MVFETLPVFVRVLGHRHGKQYLDMKACQLRVEKCDLPFDEATLFEVAYAAPGRASRHARDLGKIRLCAGGVALQGIQQAPVSVREPHAHNLPDYWLKTEHFAK
jgi:hypothetical protein